jgi:hypothetical protein
LRNFAEPIDHFVLMGVDSSLNAAPLTDTEMDVTDSFDPEALFQVSQDVDLRNLFECVEQCGLKNADITLLAMQGGSFALFGLQADWSRAKIEIVA